MNNCKICGNPTICPACIGRLGGKVKSKAKAQAARENGKLARRLVERVGKRSDVCVICGRSVMHAGRRRLKTCSPECLSKLQSYVARNEVWAWRWPRGPAERACTYCGKSFKPSQDRVLMCSKSCARSLYWQRRKAAKAASNAAAPTPPPIPQRPTGLGYHLMAPGALKP